MPVPGSIELRINQSMLSTVPRRRNPMAECHARVVITNHWQGKLRLPFSKD